MSEKIIEHNRKQDGKEANKIRILDGAEVIAEYPRDAISSLRFIDRQSKHVVARIEQIVNSVNLILDGRTSVSIEVGREHEKIQFESGEIEFVFVSLKETLASIREVFDGLGMPEINGDPDFFKLTANKEIYAGIIDLWSDMVCDNRALETVNQWLKAHKMDENCFETWLCPEPKPLGIDFEPPF